MTTSSQLNNCFLPIYNTDEGRQVYEDTLSAVNERFPQYVREIEGIADGSQVEFHKVNGYSENIFKELKMNSF